MSGIVSGIHDMGQKTGRQAIILFLSETQSSIRRFRHSTSPIATNDAHHQPAKPRDCPHGTWEFFKE